MRLTKKEISMIPKSFDIVGDILIFSEFPKELENKIKLIEKRILKIHKKVKVITTKSEKHSGKYRTKKVKILAGEKRKETVHIESGIKIKLNIETCYFSPRLSNERLRIAKLTKKGESVLVMFSGIGIYPLVISKNSNPKEIYGIEINLKAHKYAEENIKLNKTNNIRLFKGDVRKVLPKIRKKFDRIIMPLPKEANKFLDLTYQKLKKDGIVHLYSFANEEEIKEIKVPKYFKILKIVKCGKFAPGVYRICIDLKSVSTSK